jgi:hypothetical protein
MTTPYPGSNTSIQVLFCTGLIPIKAPPTMDKNTLINIHGIHTIHRQNELKKNIYYYSNGSIYYLKK